MSIHLISMNKGLDQPGNNEETIEILTLDTVSDIIQYLIHMYLAFTYILCFISLASNCDLLLMELEELYIW